MLAVRPSLLRCAYCRDDLGPAVLTCVACRTLIHEECELDACPTLGCGSLAPWELVLPLADPIPPAHVAALALLAGTLALLVGVGTHAGLVAVWPQRPAEVYVDPTPPTPPGPEPDVPALDPWRWWAPGSEIVVRTRTRWLTESPWRACGGASGSDWGLEVKETETLVRLRWTTDQGVHLRTQTVGEDRASFDWRPLELIADDGETLAERAGVPVVVPAGAFPATRYRKASCPWWEGPMVLYLSGALVQEGLEETWSDPRIPVPLRRLVTWHVDGAPPELGDCTLETVVVAIRGQAAR